MSEPGSFFEQYNQPVTRASVRRGAGRRWGLVLAALAALAVVAGVAFFALRSDDPGTSPRDARLDEALAAHVDGRLGEASAMYAQILADDPSNKFALYNLGLIAQTQGRPEDAERSYRATLTVDPTYGPALFNLAVLRYEAEDYTEAIDLYRQLLAAEPDNATAHLNLGYALRDAGFVEEGDASIETAIELDPALAARRPQDTGTDGPAASDEGTTTTTVAEDGAATTTTTAA